MKYLLAFTGVKKGAIGLRGQFHVEIEAEGGFMLFRMNVTMKRVRQLLRSMNGSRTFVITRQAGTGHVYVEKIDIMKLPPERWDYPGTPAAIGRFSLLRDLNRTRAGNTNKWPRR